jgi:hypothetical protein
MSTIFLDPVAMDATAGAIGEHAREIQTSVSTLESTCSADVPLSLTGWLAEELHDIAVQAQLVALLYTLAALDTALRAQQIQADQSLVAAQPALISAPVDLGAVLAGSAVIGGPSPYGVISGGIPGPTTMTIGGPSDIGVVFGMSMGPSFATIGGTPTYAHDPLLAMASQLQHSNPGLSAQLLGVSSGLSESRNNSITNLLAPDGLSFVGSGTYEDEFGRSGGLGQTYRDPRTGELRF